MIVRDVETHPVLKERNLETDFLTVGPFGFQVGVILRRRQVELIAATERVSHIVYIENSTPGGVITYGSVVGAEFTGRQPGRILQMLEEDPAAGDGVIVIRVCIDGQGGRPVAAECPIQREEVPIGQGS